MCVCVCGSSGGREPSRVSYSPGLTVLRTLEVLALGYCVCVFFCASDVKHFVVMRTKYVQSTNESHRDLLVCIYNGTGKKYSHIIFGYGGGGASR